MMGAGLRNILVDPSCSKALQRLVRALKLSSLCAFIENTVYRKGIKLGENSNAQPSARIVRFSNM